ncbi:MAG: hypothetical protein RIC38_05105 [Chromatocurvus sp.]
MAPNKAAKRNAAGNKSANAGNTFVDFVRSIKFRKKPKVSETPDCESHFAQLESPVDVRRQRFTSEDYQLIRSAN